MPHWFVIPSDKEAAFRALYAGKGVEGNEAVGTLVPNADGSRLFTGSSRVTPAKAAEIAADAIPWLEIYDTWPPPGGWEYPQ